MFKKLFKIQKKSDEFNIQQPVKNDKASLEIKHGTQEFHEIDLDPETEIEVQEITKENQVVENSKELNSNTKTECDVESSSNSVSQNTENEIKQKMLAICTKAEELKMSDNWGITRDLFADMKVEFEDLQQLCNNQEYETRFQESYLKFQNRYENYKKNKKIVEEKEALCKKISDFLEHPDHNTINAMDEYVTSWDKLEKAPERYEEILEKKFLKLKTEYNNYRENSENEKKMSIAGKSTLEDFYSKMLSLTHIPNITPAAINEAKQIKEKCDKILADNPILDEYKNKLLSAYESVKGKIENIQNELESVKKLNLESAVAICKEIEDIIVSPEKIKLGFTHIKEIAEKWQKLDIKNLSEEVKSKYNSLYSEISSKIKFNYEKQDWARWESYTKKLLLCEEIEALKNEVNTFKIAKELNTLWEKWKKTGSVPKEHNETIWERFNSIRQELKERCNLFFTNLKEESAKNLVIKEKLCNEAELLKAQTDNFEETAEKLKQLQEEWRNTGKAPNPQNEELYNKFRNACNDFFQKRADHYNEIHKLQEQNKEVKKGICIKAETLLTYKIDDNAFRLAKELREDWKNAGHTNRKDEQKLWEKFNTILDQFYQKADAEKPLNLESKLDISRKLDSVFELDFSLCKINKLYQILSKSLDEWYSVGSVPKEFERKTWETFKKSYNQLLDKIHNFELHSIENTAENFYNLEKTIFTLNSFSANDIDKIKNNWDEIINQINDKVLTDSYEKRFHAGIEKIKMNQEFSSISDSILIENLKTKRKCCLQLEQFSGVQHKEEHNLNSNTLADELKFAIENNFSGSKPSFESNEETFSHADIIEIWNNSNPVKLEEFKKIMERFLKAQSTYNFKQMANNLTSFKRKNLINHG